MPLTPLIVEVYNDAAGRDTYGTQVGRLGKQHPLSFDSLINLIRFRQGDVKLLEYRR